MATEGEESGEVVVVVTMVVGEVKSFSCSSCSTSLISSWTEEVPDVISRPSLSILAPNTRNSNAASSAVYRRGTNISCHTQNEGSGGVGLGRVWGVT